jgi:hypothetical protein
MERAMRVDPVASDLRRARRAAALAGALLMVGLAGAPRRAAAAPRDFPAGSLVIPMDLAYQDRGLLQAYGLLFQLLRQGVPVAWAIEPTKTWHAAPCNTPGDLCGWDCAIEGSGVKCPYPTASPDFFAATEVVWDPTAPRGTAITRHGYRGGPFVIQAVDAARARPIIDAWNDRAQWPANPWAQRTVFQVVTVHAATAPFQATVLRDLRAAPTIAVFSDGNEDIATAYLRAAGIPQSNGREFPAGKCNAGGCGPGTLNPDMLTVPGVAGDMGTCGAPSSDHKNGALFTDDGVPAYCQIMSMHWNVTDRETVQCGGGNCPATQGQCPPATPITYHGHEVVAEVREFLRYPVHFFAECQAVNAYENTTPNPAWPFLDDEGRDGHFLTTTGNPPACPCTDADFQCVVGGCNGVDCCLPRDVKERGAGFLIGARPPSVKVRRPEVPYNQLDGAFETIGGSEPSYNLSTYLGTRYKNDREVVLLTGPNGPGVDDVWMTGYADGECDIGPPIPLQGGAGNARTPAAPGEECAGGKVSYLGGHAYSVGTPVSQNGNTQGARLFLNALFEADCVTTAGQPAITLSLQPSTVETASVPVERAFAAGYANNALGAALDAVMTVEVPAGVTIVDATGGTVAGATATWDIGSIGGVPGVQGDPPASASRPVTLRFADHGEYAITLRLSFRAGLTTLQAPTAVATVRVVPPGQGGDAGPGGDGGGNGGVDSGGCCDGGGGRDGRLVLAALVIGALLARRRSRARA